MSANKETGSTPTTTGNQLNSKNQSKSPNVIQSLKSKAKQAKEQAKKLIHEKKDALKKRFAVPQGLKSTGHNIKKSYDALLVKLANTCDSDSAQGIFMSWLRKFNITQSKPTDVVAGQDQNSGPSEIPAGYDEQPDTEGVSKILSKYRDMTIIADDGFEVLIFEGFVDPDFDYFAHVAAEKREQMLAPIAELDENEENWPTVTSEEKGKGKCTGINEVTLTSSESNVPENEDTGDLHLNFEMDVDPTYLYCVQSKPHQCGFQDCILEPKAGECSYKPRGESRQLQVCAAADGDVWLKRNQFVKAVEPTMAVDDDHKLAVSILDEFIEDACLDIEQDICSEQELTETEQSDRPGSAVTVIHIPSRTESLALIDIKSIGEKLEVTEIASDNVVEQVDTLLDDDKSKSVIVEAPKVVDVIAKQQAELTINMKEEVPSGKTPTISTSKMSTNDKRKRIDAKSNTMSNPFDDMTEGELFFNTYSIHQLTKMVRQGQLPAIELETINNTLVSAADFDMSTIPAARKLMNQQ